MNKTGLLSNQAKNGFTFGSELMLIVTKSLLCEEFIGLCFLRPRALCAALRITDEEYPALHSYPA